MSVLEWDETFSVNVKEIDEQHKRLVGLLNDLCVAMKQDKTKKVLKGILHGLSEYTVYHFGTEEKYFDKFGYELADEHRAEHKKFIDKVVQFQDEFDKDEALLSMKMLSFLVSWVTDHIKGSDKKYSKCFIENGLK